MNVSDLEILSEDLLEKTIALRKQIKEDSSGVMIFEKDLSDLINNAHLGYEIISKDYKVFSGKFSKPKKMYLLSYFYLIITTPGIYSPFTGEANINIYLPHIDLPSTICHEMAHQRGFAREDEANFISYLACKNHPNINFRYSGYLEALNQAMRQLYRYDKNIYYSIKNRYSQGMKNDLSIIDKFWKKYYGTSVQKTSNKIYDSYLKTNKQKDGIRSYGRVVDLLIAEFKANSN